MENRFIYFYLIFHADFTAEIQNGKRNESFIAYAFFFFEWNCSQYKLYYTCQHFDLHLTDHIRWR